MAYGINDIKQASLGAVVASLLVVLIRTEPINIDPTKGLLIGLIWIYIVTQPYITKSYETKIHAIGNVVVTLVVASILCLTFNLVTMEQLTSFAIFGSTPWAVLMIALPTSTFWDKFNITSQYDRWYLKRRN